VEDGRTLLQCPNSLCYISPEWAIKDPNSILTCHIHTVACTCHRIFLCSRPYSKPGTSGHSVHGPEQHSQVRKCVVSKIQRELRPPPQALCSFVGYRRSQMQQLLLPHQEKHLEMSHTIGPLEISLWSKAANVYQMYFFL
jgi:hypothetical protein